MTIHFEITKENIMKAPKLIASKILETAKSMLNKRIRLVDVTDK